MLLPRALALACALVALVSGCGGGNNGSATADNLIVVDTSAPAPVRAGPRPILEEVLSEQCSRLPDGAFCTESGVGSRCYQGRCMGVDAQCKAAWSDYTGTWVGGGRNGVPGQCPNDCGELMCTNTDWTNYCYNYQCPAGYRCVVNGQTVTGPAVVPVCNCLKVQNQTSVYVQDGTPCGASGSDHMCLNRTCVQRPAAQSAQGRSTR